VTPSVSLAGRSLLLPVRLAYRLSIATVLHGLGAKVAIGDIDEYAVNEAGSGWDSTSTAVWT